MITLSFILLSSFSATTHPVILFDHVRGQDVPIVEVGRVTDGATDADRFAVDLAPVLRRFTASTGFEACAAFCRAPDGRHGAIITSIGSQVACPVTNACPDGYTATPSDIHSHPPARSIKSNAIDRLHLPFAVDKKRPVVVHPDVFSELDKTAPDGYLVTSRAVKNFKDGVERKVSDL